MIPIKNIYYMLSYAFQILNEQGYRNLSTEQFNNTGDLCAAILIKGITQQLKRGLGKAYVLQTTPLSSLKGKVDITDSIKTNSLQKRQLICSFDEFTENSPKNQILKTTMMLLLHAEISKKRKKDIRKLLVYFVGVQQIDISTINWSIRYNRNNQTYRMLVMICYLVIKGLLQSKDDGTKKLMDFLDEQHMSRLFEKFVLEYYRREFPHIVANASQISWQLDDGNSDMLPVMQTDVMLSHREKILIIDTKYYSRTTQINYGIQTLHSSNLYQIFTYVKNKEVELKHSPYEVSGLLLYAKTDDDFYLDKTYRMSGNKISVSTLDLDCDFIEIKRQLDSIFDQLSPSPNLVY
jgi:5-methylcytosine-specific restriction enzyme subunit McrC